MKLRKIFFLGTVGALFVFTSCATTGDRTPSATRNWKFDYARYVINDVVNAKTGKSVYEAAYDGYSECRIDLAQRDVLQGKLQIYQYSDDSYIRSFRTITVPNVQAKMEIKGINIQCHHLRKNSSLALRNLSGKTIEDILATKYHGQKLGVSAAFTVAVNVNEAVMVNSAGVVVTNVEQMLNVDLDMLPLGAGVVISYHTLQFDQSNLTSANESVSISNFREDGTPSSSVKANLTDALGMKL